MRLIHLLTGSAIAASLNAAVFAAAPVIVVGSSDLLPNQAGQQLQLLVSGTDQIVGEDLYIQLDPLSGGAPSITGINLLTGTIFAGNNTGAKGVTIGTGTLSNFAAASTTTASGTVSDSGTIFGYGLLVTLTINTTGLYAGGVIHLNMSTTNNGVPSDFIAGATSGPLTLISPTYASNLISIDVAPVREWNVNHGGTWAVDSNWTPFAPYANGDQANFLDAVTSGIANVTLDGDRTAGSITFNDTAGSYLISQGIENGSIHLNGTLPAITNLAGNQTISAPVILSAATHIGLNGSASILTMSGVISGNQNLSISGPGTLVLTAANSLGNATMSAGATVMLAGQGAVGSGVTVDTTASDFVFNRTDSYVSDTTFISSGSLTQAGSGSTTLTGSNTYSGPTFINAGNLIIGNNGTTGTLGTGHVTDSGVLTFNRSNALSITASISGTGSIIEQGSGSTTLNGNGYTATGPVSVSQGTLAFSNTTNARQAPGVLLKMSSLSVSPNAVVDTTNHDLIIGNTSETAVTNEIFAGFGAGSPGDPEITSSTALANGNTFLVPLDATEFGIPSWDGVNVDQPNSVVVKYTYFGDATLDGQVNIDDLGAVIGNFGATTPGVADVGLSWIMGDMALEGTVGIDDLGLVISNFGLGVSSGTLGSLDGSAAEASGVAPALGGSSPVPEPASLALLGIGAMAVLRRSRFNRLNRI